MSKFLIFGANNEISMYLTSQFLNENHEVFGVIHKNIDKIHPFIHLLTIDEAIASNIDFDAIFIIGAFVPYGSFNIPDPRFFDSNVKPAQVFHQFFPKAHLILLSSVSVFGSNGGFFKEDSPIQIDHLYSGSKYDAEKILEDHSSYSIIRLGSIFGKMNSTNGFIDRCIYNARINNEITLLGDGARFQDYIHIEEVAKLLYLSWKHLAKGIFLGVSGTSLSNLEIAEFICKHTGAKLKFSGNDSSPSFHYNNDYTKTMLNFDPPPILEKIKLILSNE